MEGNQLRSAQEHGGLVDDWLQSGTGLCGASQVAVNSLVISMKDLSQARSITVSKVAGTIYRED
jgi:hypothetical protein